MHHRALCRSHTFFAWGKRRCLSSIQRVATVPVVLSTPLCPQGCIGMVKLLRVTGLAYGSPLVPECRTQKVSGFDREYLAVHAGREVPEVSHRPPIHVHNRALCRSKAVTCVKWSGRTILRTVDTCHNLQKNQTCPHKCQGKLCWSMD